MKQYTYRGFVLKPEVDAVGDGMVSVFIHIHQDGEFVDSVFQDTPFWARGVRTTQDLIEDALLGAEGRVDFIIQEARRGG